MVFSITVLYLGFNYLKGIDFFSSNDKYYALFNNVDGLNVSNPIYINGFVVGRVSDIRLVQKDTAKVLVEMDIKGDIVVGDSAVAVLSGDFLGNKSILVNPGNINFPINSGDTITARLDRAITDILAESAQPVANNLEATIKKVNAILDQLGGTRGKIDSILDEFHQTPILLNATIRRTGGSLDTIANVYTRVGRNLEQSLNKAQPLLENLTQLSDSLKHLELNATVNEARAAIENLNTAIDQFNKTDGTLGKLIHEDSLYVNLNNAVQSMDRLLIHIDTQPKHFFSPLGKSADKIERDRRKDREEEDEN